jgi:hypothetical protein
LLFIAGGSAGIFLVGQFFGVLGATCKSSLLCNPDASLIYGGLAGWWLSRTLKPWARLDDESSAPLTHP